MLTNILFLLLLCSGSIYCAARYQHGFEEALPLTSIGIVLLVFICGVCGCLVAGVCVSIILAVVLYVLSIVELTRRKQIKGFFRALITPGSVVFVILFFAISYLNYGKLAYQWDEFSHWVDIVKVMTNLDDFGTNALSHSAFQSYPPGMSIFQYLLQKLTVWINPENPFSEWRVFVAYQVFCVIPFIPLFKMCTFRRPLHLLVTCTAVFLTPLLFFNDLYNSVYIDPFLGLVSGAGLALVLLCEKKDWLYHGLIWFYCAILVLSKDVGMMFAIFLMIAYIAELFLRKEPLTKPGSIRKKLFLCLGVLIACFLPKLLWSLELSLSNATISFSQEIDFAALIGVLQGTDATYRDTVLSNYVYSQFEKGIALGHTTITIHYYVLFFCVVLLLVFLTRSYLRHKSENPQAAIAVAVTTVIQMLVYIVGLCIIYLFKFSPGEATNLASMERYLNMVYLASWIVIVVLACYATRHWVSGTAVELCVLCVLLAVSPVRNFVSFADGTNIETAASVRKNYDILNQQIHEFCDGDDRIFFVAQDDNGRDYWISRFNARPNTFNPNFTWGLGETEYQGGIYAVPKTAEQWREELLAGYDYVALYRLNPYFYEHYACLFENPDEIYFSSLYRVDKESGLLVKCN